MNAPLCAIDLSIGDLFDYVGSFRTLRVLTAPEHCTRIEGRILFKVRVESAERKLVLEIRLKAEQPVTLIQSGG